jgi:hypothetical protein
MGAGSFTVAIVNIKDISNSGIAIRLEAFPEASTLSRLYEWYLSRFAGGLAGRMPAKSVGGIGIGMARKSHTGALNGL